MRFLYSMTLFLILAVSSPADEIEIVVREDVDVAVLVVRPQMRGYYFVWFFRNGRSLGNRRVSFEGGSWTVEGDRFVFVFTERYGCVRVVTARDFYSMQTREDMHERMGLIDGPWWAMNRPMGDLLPFPED